MAMQKSKSVIEMTAVKVYPYRQAHRPLLWLGEKDAEHPRLLPIAIGEFEAAAIHMHLTGETPRRPISYDLFTSILNQLEVPVEFVEIHAVRNSTFFARISFHDEENNRCLDARPSDAVALALRTKAPIYVSHDLLAYAGIEPLAGDQGFEHTMEQFYKLEPQIIKPEAIQSEPAETPQEEDQAVDVAKAADQTNQDQTATSVPNQQISQLQAQMDQAIVCEEYEEAARLRDEIFYLKKTHV